MIKWLRGLLYRWRLTGLNEHEMEVYRNLCGRLGGHVHFMKLSGCMPHIDDGELATLLYSLHDKSLVQWSGYDIYDSYVSVVEW